MSNINFEKHKSPTFELVLQMRDHVGNPTGRTKTFASDDHEELDNWYQRNSGSKKGKRKKENKTKEETT